ncbi:MAG: acetate--CoA ligase family protein, partial [bacterium]|nr:acetate--CoA ligase family protein [bacterium]
MRRNLEKLFSPKSIAVVGASSDLQRLGGRPIYLHLAYGFEGPIYPINPNRDEIGGLKCYPDVASLPETPDFVLINVPRDGVLPALRQCAERKVPTVAIMTSGFREVGEEGAALEAELVRLARESGMRILGPNCMGIVHVRSKLMATFTIAIRDDNPLRPGPVAIVTQSGALGACMISAFQDRGSGLSAMVSLGNESDVDFPACVDYLLDDPDTRVICAYLESIKDGPRLRAAAERALEVGKPIVLLRGGSTAAGAQAAMSHTAAMTTPTDVFDAFARQFGIEVCDSFDGLVETVEFLAASGKGGGTRLGILSFSGGAGSMAADRAQNAGFSVPPLAGVTQRKLREALSEYAAVVNPVDLVSLMVSRKDGGALTAAGDAVLADPGIDAVCLVMGVYHHVGEEMAALLRDLFERSEKPLALCWLTGPRGPIDSLRQNGIPVFEDIVRAVDALAAHRRFGEVRERSGKAGRSSGDEGRRAQAREILKNAGAGPDGALPPEACQALADLYGLSRPREVIADSPEAAARAGEEMGAPVALKVLSAEVVHKTEAGGVAVGLSGGEEIRRAAQDMLARVPGARLLVQQMVSGGVELLAGVTHDPAFGPCVTAGIGGVLVEVLNDLARRLPPFDADEGARMLGELRGAGLFGAFRGRPP